MFPAKMLAYSLAKDLASGATQADQKMIGVPHKA
jgi:hypothetical protein